MLYFGNDCSGRFRASGASIVKPLIDENFSRSSDVNPLKIPVLLLAVFLFKGLAEYASNVLSQWVANKVITDIRDAVFTHQLNVSKLPIGITWSDHF